MNFNIKITDHFLRCFDKILAEGYTPRLEDILNLRIATTGNTKMPYGVIYLKTSNICDSNSTLIETI